MPSINHTNLLDIKPLSSAIDEDRFLPVYGSNETSAEDIHEIMVNSDGRLSLQALQLAFPHAQKLSFKLV